jgi:hypothetical protein
MERGIPKTITDRSSACGRRNGWRYRGWSRGAAVGFLVAYDPIKNMIKGWCGLGYGDTVMAIPFRKLIFSHTPSIPGQSLEGLSL